MAEYLTTDTDMTSIANAIRTKGGTSAALTYPVGFVSAIEAIPAGGGSSYTLLATQEFEVSTTSTSSISVGTVYAGAEAFTSNKILCVRIRDKNGSRQGYFYESYSFYINPNPANGVSLNLTTGSSRIVIARRSNGSWLVTGLNSSTGYGVYSYMVSTSGDISIMGKYDSKHSFTIDGTYVVEVYLLDWPDGISPFE